MDSKRQTTDSIAAAFIESDSYLKDDFINLNDINVPLIFRKLFPEHPYPAKLELPIKMGLPLKFSKDLQESFDLEPIWQSYDLDYDVSKHPFIDMQLLANDNFLVKIVYADAFGNTLSQASQNFLEKQKRENPETVSKIEISGKMEDMVQYITAVQIFHNPMFNPTEFTNFFIFLNAYCNIEDIHEGYDLGRSSISMLVREGSAQFFRDFSVKNDSTMDHADLIYGEGFVDFSDDLLHKLIHEKKGLVLFHGQPGTGKTFYIRNLLRELSTEHKRVIYIPPSLVEYMMEPDMLNFIINDITENAEDTILLIEDAEPLLESRNSGTRTTGISNLLNSTDGILNDILGLIVIATFNTDLGNIDKALLRPGRLLARKEFSTIPTDNLLEVAKVLNVPLEKIEKDQDYTIAQLMGISDDKKIVKHDVQESRQIGFKR